MSNDEAPRPRGGRPRWRLAWQVVLVGLPVLAALVWLDWRSARVQEQAQIEDRLQWFGLMNAMADEATPPSRIHPAAAPIDRSTFETDAEPGRVLALDAAHGRIELVGADGIGRRYRFDRDVLGAGTASTGPRSTGNILVGGLAMLGVAALATHLLVGRRLDRLSTDAAARLGRAVERRGDEIDTLHLTMRTSLDRLEQARLERHRLAMVAEHTSNAVVITDARRRITWVNDAFTTITGFTLKEVIGRVPGHVLQTEETDPETITRIRSSLDRGEPACETIFNRAKDGRGYWLSLDIHPVADDDGEPIGFIAVESDITELKDVQNRLAETERRLRMVIEGAELGTWDWNIESGEVVFNERWCRMLGYDPSEIEPHVRSWELVVHPEDVDMAMAALQDHFEGRTDTYRCEHRLRHKDGSVIWVLDAGRVYEWDDDGRPIKAAGIHLDITDARESARRYELAAAGASVGIWDWNIISGEVHLSRRWKEILGYEDDELEDCYESWHDHLHPDDRDRVVHGLEAHLRRHGTFDLEYRMRTRTNDYRWVHARGQASWGFDGKPLRMAGSLADIHDRKLAELARERLAAIVEHSEDAILGLALDGTIEIANPACETLFGRDPESLVGSHESMLIPEDDRAAELRYVERVATGERVPPREGRRLRADGREVEVSIALSVVRDDDDRVIGYAKIVRDITERREKRSLQESHEALAKLNALLAHKNARLEEMTERAHRFVDDVSHEFRTPLTVIKEYTSLILDGLGGEVSPDQQDWLRTIDVATVDLNTMVEDFLDSSKLRAGRLRVDRRTLEVRDLLDDVDRLLARKAESAGITLRFACPADLPTVFADREKARRIVINLATNAIKFSPRGSTVRITAQDLGEDVEIAVRDEGPGLSDEDRATLFERFRQLPSAMSPSVKGFGLGLNIARQLVWLNLGRIEVDSEPGRGPTFRFTLPLDRADVIVERFLSAQRQREDWPSRLGVIEVIPSVEGRTEQWRRLLAAVCHASDIRLVSPTDGRMVVFGPSEDVTAWRDLLARHLDEERPESESLVDLQTLADVPFPEGIDTARAVILSSLGRHTGALRA